MELKKPRDGGGTSRRRMVRLWDKTVMLEPAPRGQSCRDGAPASWESWEQAPVPCRTPPPAAVPRLTEMPPLFCLTQGSSASPRQGPGGSLG